MVLFIINKYIQNVHIVRATKLFDEEYDAIAWLEDVQRDAEQSNKVCEAFEDINGHIYRIELTGGVVYQTHGPLHLRSEKSL